MRGFLTAICALVLAGSATVVDGTFPNDIFFHHHPDIALAAASDQNSRNGYSANNRYSQADDGYSQNNGNNQAPPSNNYGNPYISDYNGRNTAGSTGNRRNRASYSNNLNPPSAKLSYNEDGSINWSKKAAAVEYDQDDHHDSGGGGGGPPNNGPPPPNHGPPPPGPPPPPPGPPPPPPGPPPPPNHGPPPPGPPPPYGPPPPGPPPQNYGPPPPGPPNYGPPPPNYGPPPPGPPPHGDDHNGDHHDDQNHGNEHYNSKYSSPAANVASYGIRLAGANPDDGYKHGVGTFYDLETHVSTCGRQSKNTDYVVAINIQDFGEMKKSNPDCGKEVEVVGPSGKTIHATVVDGCKTCQAGGLDLSPAAYDELGEFSHGSIPIKWKII